jgi:hypothetical protein
MALLLGEPGARQGDSIYPVLGQEMLAIGQFEQSEVLLRSGAENPRVLAPDRHIGVRVQDPLHERGAAAAGAQEKHRWFHVVLCRDKLLIAMTLAGSGSLGAGLGSISNQPGIAIPRSSLAAFRTNRISADRPRSYT